jgi:integrase
VFARCRCRLIWRPRCAVNANGRTNFNCGSAGRGRAPVTSSSMTLANPPHPDTVTHAWADVLAAAGLPRVRPHDAQHSCATLIHLNGIPETVIAAWLGYTDARFTLSVYTHSNNGALADAAAKMGSIFSGAPQ